MVFQLSTIFTKCFIVDVLQGSEYASETGMKLAVDMALFIIPFTARVSLYIGF